MGIFLNILVIIIAVIAFLVIYYSNLKKDRKSQDYQLPFRKTRAEYETGEEIGVDKKSMFESVQNDLKEKLEIDSESSFNFYENNSNYKENERMKDIEKYQLNDRSGKNFIRLFTRDPYYLFAYWEINEQEFYDNIPCLRLHNEKHHNYYDITINHQACNWYLHAEPDNKYRVTIGYIKDGVYFPIASSKIIETPLDRPSNIIDEHWMTIEELSRYCFRIEMDSLSLLKNIERRKLQEELEANSLTLIQK